MATITLTTNELNALTGELDAIRAELAAMIPQRDALSTQLKMVSVERDLLKEKLAAQLRQLFAAKSESCGTEQKDLFLNEAEALAPTVTTPIAEEVAADDIEVAGHIRKKRKRKPLDPNLPREVIRHELPESERVCRMTGRLW
jgi:hypothetical protein